MSLISQCHKTIKMYVYSNVTNLNVGWGQDTSSAGTMKLKLLTFGRYVRNYTNLS